MIGARYFQGDFIVEWDRYGEMILTNAEGRIKLDGDQWAFIIEQVRHEWPETLES